MKNWKIFIIVLLILIISAAAYKFYPCERNIFNGSFYDIQQSDLGKEFTIEINLKDNINEVGKKDVNRVIFNGNDTQVILDKIINENGRVDVFINSKINWHLRSGTCLSINNISDEMGYRTFSTGDISFVAADNKGKKLDAQFGLGPSELLVFTFDKKDLADSDKIYIKVKGYKLTNYKFKLF